MELFFSAFISYFVIIDPIGVSLIFIGLTMGKSKQYVNKMAFRSIAIAFSLAIIFGMIGEPFLAKLGISIHSFRIAGGLMLFYTAFSMVTRDELYPMDKNSSEEVDVSVYPLAIPLLSGPGCLTLTVLLGANAKTQDNGFLYVLGAIIAIFAFTLICFLTAERLARLIGKTGNDILKRLLGVLLAALSIQFISDGIRGVMQ